MSTVFGIAVALMGQVTAPAPPVSAPRLRTYAEEAEQIGRELRNQCMSDAGVRTVVREITAKREAMKATEPKMISVERELSAALYAVPLDLARVETAMAARNRGQVDYYAMEGTGDMRLLRQLSPADRAIYARRITYIVPDTVVSLPGCAAPR